MFGLSLEHLIILLIVLLVLGPRRLPDLGHSMGRTIKNFRDAMNGIIEPKSDPVAKAQAPVATLLPPSKETSASPLPKDEIHEARV